MTWSSILGSERSIGISMNFRVLPFGLPLLLSGCGTSNYNWGWYTVLPFTERGADNLNFMIAGAWATISISVLAILGSVLLGQIGRAHV